MQRQLDGWLLRVKRHVKTPFQSAWIRPIAGGYRKQYWMNGICGSELAAEFRHRTLFVPNSI